jgi:hypothetical protein
MVARFYLVIIEDLKKKNPPYWGDKSRLRREEGGDAMGGAANGVGGPGGPPTGTKDPKPAPAGKGRGKGGNKPPKPPVTLEDLAGKVDGGFTSVKADLDQVKTGIRDHEKRITSLEEGKKPASASSSASSVATSTAPTASSTSNSLLMLMVIGAIVGAIVAWAFGPMSVHLAQVIGLAAIGAGVGLVFDLLTD